MPVRHDNSPLALQRAKARQAMKPGRQKKSGRGSGLTPRIRQAIELIVFGDDDGTVFKSDRDVAAAVGVTARTLRAAMLKPAVEAYHRQQLTAKRNGLKALGLHTIEGVLIDPELKKTAAGSRVAIEAAKVVLVDPPGTQVNVQINNNLSVTPGYVLDLRPEADPPHVIDHDDFVTVDDIEAMEENDV